MTYHRDMIRIFPLLMLCACSEYNVSAKAVTVTGAAPAIEVDPRTVDFGTVDSLESSVDRVVTVTNIGDAPLEIYSVRLGTPAAEFSVTALDETILPMSEDLNLVVSYTPIGEGESSDVLIIESSDPEEPESLVDLNGQLLFPEEIPPDIPEELGTPIIKVAPSAHNFGTMNAGDTARTEFAVRNIGDGNLVVTDALFDPSSPEMVLNLHAETNGPFPWALAPEEAKYLSLDYSPTDEGFDFSQTIFRSNDEDNPEAPFSATGTTRAFEGFSTGWYIYDDGLEHETTSSPAHPVTGHGDTDLYWYEPSGAHGLIGSPDPETDFAMMREHVLAGAGEPTPITGPISFESGSTLATFAFATFTYVMCDFWIEEGEDPASYTVQAERVDDGIQVMVNGEILGHMLLSSSATSWSLADVGRPGAVNTLIVILVDDSRSNRYLRDLAFYRDGVMVEGS